MHDVKIKVNKNGILIPFLNGVLNSKTKEFYKHDPKYYNTHIISENYDFNKVV